MAKKKAKKVKTELQKASDTFLAVLKAEQKVLEKEQAALNKQLDDQNPIESRLDEINERLDDIVSIQDSLSWTKF